MSEVNGQGSSHYFSKLRYLVVDDFENFRNSMRQMLRTFGADKIELVPNGAQAIQRCTYEHYDVVLCNYNLGEGKNGQHVLEELRHRRMLLHSSLFLMVTAETSREMVMGAREYHPDAYLTKPLNRAMLEKRLSALVERRSALLPITRAMDLEDIPEAISQCLHVLPRQQRHRTWIYKTLSELYIQAGDYSQAKKIFDDVISQRALSWALLGKGRVLLAEHFDQEAVATLQALVEEHPDYLEAYDALAEGLRRLGRSRQAQRVLEKAAELSPNALLRQRDLASLASANQDIDTATEAWRRTVGLGVHSVHDNPDHYLALGQTLSDLSEGDPGGEGRGQADEAFRILQRMQKRFPEVPDLEARSQLVESRLHLVQGARDKATACLESAMASLPQEQISAAAGLDMAKSLYRLDRGAEAESLLAELAQRFESEPEILGQIESLLDEPVGLREKLQARTFNRDGIQAFEKGDLEEAAGLFSQALDIVPGHASLNLNLAQIRMKQIAASSDQARNREYLEQTRRCLGALDRLPTQHRQYRRYQALMRKLEQL